MAMTRLGLSLAVVALSGCSYTMERPFSGDHQTVHVEMFHSKDFRRDLEFRLTESLVKRIELDTPYRIADRQTADVLISGEILGVTNRVFGTEFRTDRPREIGSTVAVRFEVKDLRDGRILLSRERFVYQTEYVPSVGESFDKGMVRGMDGLAEAMVEQMEMAW